MQRFRFSQRLLKVMLLNVKRINLSRTDVVLERLIYSPVNRPALKSFSEFSSRENFRLYINLYISYSLI